MEIPPRNIVRLEVTFKNVAGEVTEPTATELQYKEPSGTIKTIKSGSLTKISAGIWRYDLLVTESGQYWWAWIGTGTVEACEEGSFMVARKLVA